MTEAPLAFEKGAHHRVPHMSNEPGSIQTAQKQDCTVTFKNRSLVSPLKQPRTTEDSTAS